MVNMEYGARKAQFDICKYVSDYGNEFFYCFFGYRELKLFERELKKLLNKLQSVSEVESRKEKDVYAAFNKSWEFYAFGKKEDLKEYYESDIAKYKKIYDNNFSYLKLLSEINYTKNNQRLTVLAIFISVIAIMVSVLIA